MWDIKIIQGNSSDSLQNKYIFGTFIENCKVINLGYFYQKPGYSSIIRVDGTSWMAHSKLNFTKKFFTLGMGSKNKVTPLTGGNTERFFAWQ